MIPNDQISEDLQNLPYFNAYGEIYGNVNPLAITLLYWLMAFANPKSAIFGTPFFIKIFWGFISQ